MPNDAHTGIFFERQRGGLCRMHALNAYFNKALITPTIFSIYVKKYDKYLKNRFNVITSSAKFDLVNSDQTTLVAFILREHGIHVRYYSLNSAYNIVLDKEIIDAPFMFVYNDAHIWGIRRINQLYYKVDSIGGVKKININSLRREKNIGLLVPVDKRQEWYTHVRCIRNTLDINSVTTKKQLSMLLKKYHDEKHILGDLEIPMGVSISIMELQAGQSRITEFTPIHQIIDTYNEFIVLFTAGRYNDLPLILKYVPDIIFDIIKLCK
jgi:hypothetical protein